MNTFWTYYFVVGLVFNIIRLFYKWDSSKLFIVNIIGSIFSWLFTIPAWPIVILNDWFGRNKEKK